MAEKKPERLYTFRDAEQFGRKEKTWRNMFYKGELEVVRLGRRLYLKESTILKLIEAGTIPARRERVSA